MTVLKGQLATNIARDIAGIATDSSTYAKMKGVGWGQIVASFAGPPKYVTVHIGGSATAVAMRYTAGYTPVGGDVGVVLLLEGGSYLFIGLA